MNGVINRNFNGRIFRLLSSFSLIIAIFSFALFYQIQNISVDAVNLYKHPFTVSNAANNINFHVISMQKYVKDVVLSDNNHELDHAIEQVNKHEALAIQEFDIIFKRYLGDVSQIQQAYNTLLQWRPIRQETIKLAKEGQHKAAFYNSQNQCARHIAKLNQEVALLINFAHIKAKELKQNAETERHYGNITLLIILITTLCIFFFVYRRLDARYIVESKRAHKALKWSKEILNASPDPMLIINKTGDITLSNAKASLYFKYSKEEFKHLNIADLIPARFTNHASFVQSFFASKDLKSRPMGMGNSLFTVNKHGLESEVEISLSLAEFAGERVAITSIRDVTERKKIEKKVIHQANYDFLTNIPNRFLAMEKLSQSIADAKRNQTKVAVLFIDLDDFKKINDTLGHDIGDKLLIQSSARFKHCVRANDAVGRLGGDEFIIILKDIIDRDFIADIASKIIAALNQPFNIESRELHLGASIGISIFPDDSENEEELLSYSDLAMYNAKDNGRNQYSFFNHTLQISMNERLQLESALKTALKDKEFHLLYQPKYSLSDQKIVGFEALLRWNSKQLGVISPDKFIPILEKIGLIKEVGLFVLDQALDSLKKWQLTSQSHLHMAVNFSPLQFTQKDLHHVIEQKLVDLSMLEHALEIEITEGLLLRDEPRVLETLHELHTKKVNIALDDFGTGYSSMSYLQKYPFSSLKIDRSFISNITHDDTNKALIETTIHMAHRLGLKVTAEGIESAEQLTFLKNIGCDIGQGYYFSKPVPESEVLALLTAQAPNSLPNVQ